MIDRVKPTRATSRFMRLLIGGGTYIEEGERVVVQRSGSRATLSIGQIHDLIAVGLVERNGTALKARPEARAWLKRQMVDDDQTAAQHRTTITGVDGVTVNLAESPLGRLATPANGNPAFLASHQLAAGERVRRLFEQAHLVQRTTMSYDPSRVASSGGGSRNTPVSDMAMDARTRLNHLMTELPADCAGVVMDVCGYLKGLQQVETERQWPRRSAKLVLRIGLDQAANLLGLSEAATGAENGRDHSWMDIGARPSEVG